MIGPHLFEFLVCYYYLGAEELGYSTAVLTKLSSSFSQEKLKKEDKASNDLLDFGTVLHMGEYNKSAACLRSPNEKKMMLTP